MKHFNLRNLMTAIVATCCLSITACNTIGGVGADVESAGNAVENAAK